MRVTLSILMASQWVSESDCAEWAAQLADPPTPPAPTPAGVDQSADWKSLGGCVGAYSGAERGCVRSHQQPLDGEQSVTVMVQRFRSVAFPEAAHVGNGSASDGLTRPPKRDSGPRRHPESRFLEFGSRSEAATRAAQRASQPFAADKPRPRRDRSWLRPRSDVLRHAAELRGLARPQRARVRSP